MRYVKWAFWLILAILVFSFFHYTLPQRDIARVVDTEVRRVDFGENSLFWAGADVGTDPTAINRDVRFINTIRTNGRPMVYRNEDTGWGWPPYFKLDSSNLQTEAGDLASTPDDPQWVVVTHYGWRSEFFTIYPNAVGVRPIADPNVTLIPWLNIVILSLIAILLFWVWRIWRRFRTRSIDPLIEDATDAVDRIDARADAAKGRIGRWLDSWRSKRR